MKAEPIETVSLQFKDCDAGWIHFTIAAGAQSVAIRASHVYDPFPDFIRWMNAMLTGVEECAFAIEEEGPEKEVVARRRWDGNLLFLVRDPGLEPRELIRVIVSRRQLIEALYTGVRDFARSPAYRKDQWEEETLGDRLRCLLPTWDEGRIFEHLIGLDRQELGKTLFDAAPSYLVHFPDAPDEKAEFRRAIDYLLDPDDPAKSAGLYEEPQEWNISDDYDNWPASRRTSFVLELLRERVSGYGGCKLQEWESPSIERYLEHPEVDDGTWQSLGGDHRGHSGSDQADHSASVRCR